jgi:V8-like Glu-specific endopeptidase
MLQCVLGVRALKYLILVNTTGKRSNLFKILLGTSLSILSLSMQLVQPLAAAVFDRQGKQLSEINLDPDDVNWQLLSSQSNRAYNGIGLIKIRDFSSCTGFFIQPQPSPTAPAYVMTNAHCIDLLENLLNPNEIVVNRTMRSYGRSPAVLTYTPGYFAKVDRGRSTYTVKRVLYATMKNNDLALLELSISQQDLMATGITPLQIMSKPAPTGTKIDVVGIPGEVIPTNRHYLHRVSCSVGETVRVKEGGYEWNQALRHRCSLVGGMSGSPMLAEGKVVGIVNTGGGTGGRRSQLCTLDNPCEISQNGKPQPTVSYNYGQLVDRLAGCFPQGVFNLQQPNCQLEKPS